MHNQKTQPKVLENIENAQKKYKQENKLSKGTKVFLKDCRLVKEKLDHKFNGTFEVME